MHRAHTADTGPAHIFIHNGSPQALVGCYENRMASLSPMHRTHTADTGPATIFIHNGAPQALVGSHGGVGSMWSTQSTAGLPLRLPRFARGGCFPRLGFPPHSNQSEGLVPFVALDVSVLRAPFQPTSSGRRLRNGRIRRSVVPPRLMSRGSGPDRSAPTAGKERPLPRPERVSSLFIHGRAPALRSCGICTPACFEPILRFPFFEAERPFVGAHRRAAIQRC